MKQYDYLNGWWHLLPNLCLLTAIIGQFNPIVLNSSTWGRISIPPLAPRAIDPLAPKAIDRTFLPTFSVRSPVQVAPPVQQPAI